jgi:hypothetical protein
MTKFFHDCTQSKRCLLILLMALLYSTQAKLEAQSCDPDVTAPVAVCVENTVVALGAGGTATVNANTFNDNSYDACCLGNFQVSRLVDGPCDEDGSQDDFTNNITFCCADIGATFSVILKVYDCAGNFNTCFAAVEVQDKLKPVCVAPANVTVSCAQFDPSLEAYGSGAHTDNCCLDNTITTLDSHLFNQYCVQGTLKRIFNVSDCSGNTSQCTQNIVVNYEQNYFVKFPNDVIVPTTNPNGNYGELTYFGVDCELMAASYSDQTFANPADADFKILRTWTVINWCTYDPGLPVISIPNPTPNAFSNHLSNLPGPIVSAAGTAPPWLATVVKINPTDPTPTDYSTFWSAAANGYEYKQIIKVIDTFFVAVQGNVFSDSSANCSYQTGETLLADWTVKATGLTTGEIKEVQTDANGAYTVTLSGVDTVVNITLVSGGNFGQNCQTNYNVNGVVGQTVSQDIPVHLEQRCALLSVGIAAPLVRRCFETRYTVQGCNMSSETVANTYVEVNLDAYLGYLQSSVPATLVSGNIYRFELGDLREGDCKSFWIDANVSCAAPLGLTHLTEAKIFPYDDCRGNSNWSGADVEVSATCDGDSVRFKIANIGDGPMTQALDFVVVEDIIMLQGSGFQLGVGEELNIAYPANGATWRLETPEEILHPFGGVQAVAVEGCGGLNQTGLVNIFPLSDSNPFVAKDCQQNVGSFDPNDKQAFPVGFSSNHYLHSNTDIEYMIRFQNTGTDTAFTVKVLDKLSSHLAPATVRVLATSHPVEFSTLESGELQFLFSNIQLPDSNVNLAASNGFLKFRVAQKLDNPEGTLIENKAAIYFDFNDPVITNTTFHTINDHFLTVGIDDPLTAAKGLKVFPNPTADAATFKFEQTVVNGRFELKNQMGQSIRNERFSGDQYLFERAGLPSGVYFFSVSAENGAVFTGKILVK